MSEPVPTATAPREESPPASPETQASRPVRRVDLRSVAPPVALATVAAVLSWPEPDLSAQAGLDPSWGIGLHLAAREGMDFGTDVLFTYGPLGFLKSPVLVDPLTVRLAFAYTALIQFLLCLTSLLLIARATGSLIVAALGALVVGGVAAQEPAVVIGFAWAVALAAGLVEGRHATWLAAGLGVLAGIELLAKLNSGLTILVVGILAVAVAPARRRLAVAYGVAAVLTFAAAWILTGQSLGALDDWVAGSFGILSGYSQTMGLSEPGSEWEYWAALVIVGVGFTAAWHGGEGSRRLRVGLLLLWAALAFTSFKPGFVRHDPGHVDIFFASTLGGLLALSWVPHRRTTGALIALLALTALFGATGHDPSRALDPFDRVDAFADQTGVLADGSVTHERIGGGIGALLGSYGMDADTFAQLEGRTVHADPWEVGAVFAQRLEWDPVPVFQSYSAYTADLDRRNARAFADAAGPERVLREIGVMIDGRNRAWESPLATREMLCHFREGSTSSRWQVLVRSPDRCGTPREVSTVQTSYRGTVEVPPVRPGELLYVEVDGLAVGGLERLRALAWKAEVRWATINGARGFRLTPGTAANGLLLGVPREADYSREFALDQDADTLAFTKGDDGLDGGDLTLRFMAQAIDPL
jgi:hypothetical protein